MWARPDWAERDLTDLRLYREIKLTWLTWPLPDREHTVPWLWCDRDLWSDRDLPWAYRELNDLIVSWLWMYRELSLTGLRSDHDLSVSWAWPDRELTLRSAWPVIWPRTYLSRVWPDCLTAPWLRAYRGLSVTCDMTATLLWADRDFTDLAATWSWAYYELNVTGPPGWIRMKSYEDWVNWLVCIAVCITLFTRTVMLLYRAGVCVVSCCPRTDQNEIVGQCVVKETDRQTDDLPKRVLHAL